ncbi:hypothetical protein [Nostoc sp.]|uniref:hypothetical protein n=1 Tax=Nostoc sp. TaxID=1180 RepID=UPI002FF638A4
MVKKKHFSFIGNSENPEDLLLESYLTLADVPASAEDPDSYNTYQKIDGRGWGDECEAAWETGQHYIDTIG